MNNEIVYPLSAQYVAHWGVPQAISEFVANSFDQSAETGAKTTVKYVDGQIVIADNGDGMTTDSLIMGLTAKEGNNDVIGVWGEGAKCAMAVCADRLGPGSVTIDTRGATLRPRLERREFALDGDACEVLVVAIDPSRKRTGTTVKITCSEDVYNDVRHRFLQLAKRGYKRPVSAGTVSTEFPGELRVGGVLFSQHDNLVCSYDFTISDAKRKNVINRDRTVIEHWALRDMVASAIAVTTCSVSLQSLAEAAISGSLDAVEFIRTTHRAETLRAWKRVRRQMFGKANVCWVDDATSPAAQERIREGWAVLASAGAHDVFSNVMSNMGVPHIDETAGRAALATVFISKQSLDAAEKKNLSIALRRARKLWGSDCVGAVKIYSKTADESALGFYDAGKDRIALKRSQLSCYSSLSSTLAHEIAHRVALKHGGEWEDCTRGFESVLSDMAGSALGKAPAVPAPSNDLRNPKGSI